MNLHEGVALWVLINFSSINVMHSSLKGSANILVHSVQNWLDIFSGLIGLLPNPVYVKDRNHDWVAANSAFCDHIDVPVDDLIGKSDYDYWPRELADLYWAVDKDVFQTRRTVKNIEEFTRRNGEAGWVESQKSYYRADDGNEFIVGILTDISELKRKEQELIQSEARARQAAESKATFLANMSHEIRTPMNGIMGIGQILMNTDLDDEQRRLVGTMDRSTGALLQVINDVLDFSKLEAGKLEIEAVPFSIRTMVDDIAELLNYSAFEKGLELAVFVKNAVPEMVVGDVGRIRQVLINLVGNAIKFTNEGHVLIEVSAEDELSGGATTINFSIIDTGIGIPEEKVAQIFCPFEQADSSTTRRFGGTGLGLAITREITAIMGGTVKVHSTPGAGSTFTVSIALPAYENTDAEVSTSAPPDLNGHRVLIVDDIPLSCDIVAAKIKQLNGVPVTAHSARRGLEILSESFAGETPICTVISDYQMPDVDGLEFIRSIRRDSRFDDVKIMVLSSVDGRETKDKFLAAGCEIYELKPVRTGAVENAIARLGFAQDEVYRETEDAPPTASASSVHVRSDLSILVAEDNSVNRMVMEKLLTPFGYHLAFAEDGEICVEEFRNRCFDLVLMDVCMPKMDGIEATRAIRAIEAETGHIRTPIIALTAHALEKERREFLAADMDSVVTKPIALSKLMAVIEKWCGEESAKVAS